MKGKKDITIALKDEFSIIQAILDGIRDLTQSEKLRLIKDLNKKSQARQKKLIVQLKGKIDPAAVTRLAKLTKTKHGTNALTMVLNCAADKHKDHRNVITLDKRLIENHEWIEKGFDIKIFLPDGTPAKDWDKEPAPEKQDYIG